MELGHRCAGELQRLHDQLGATVDAEGTVQAEMIEPMILAVALIVGLDIAGAIRIHLLQQAAEVFLVRVANLHAFQLFG
jgi:hypothetical protein